MFSSTFPTFIDFVNCFSHSLHSSLTTSYLCCMQVTDIWRKTKYTGWSPGSSESSLWLQGSQEFSCCVFVSLASSSELNALLDKLKVYLLSLFCNRLTGYILRRTDIWTVPPLLFGKKTAFWGGLLLMLD